jgi:FAD-dependent urate hydroxylase
MAHLGMGDIMETFGGPLRRMAYRDFRSEIQHFPLQLCAGYRAGAAAGAFDQRREAELGHVLAVQFGKRVTRCEENADGVTVWFTDGSSASGDLLIAAS